MILSEFQMKDLISHTKFYNTPPLVFSIEKYLETTNYTLGLPVLYHDSSPSIPSNCTRKCSENAENAISEGQIFNVFQKLGGIPQRKSQCGGVRGEGCAVETFPTKFLQPLVIFSGHPYPLWRVHHSQCITTTDV